MAPRRARKAPTKKGKGKQTPPPEGVKSAPLEPIRYVVRELTGPDGKTVRARVPVYPPFELPVKEAADGKKAS